MSVMAAAFKVSHEAASLSAPTPSSYRWQWDRNREGRIEVKTVIGGLSCSLVVQGSRDEALVSVMMPVRWEGIWLQAPTLTSPSHTPLSDRRIHAQQAGSEGHMMQPQRGGTIILLFQAHKHEWTTVADMPWHNSRRPKLVLILWDLCRPHAGRQCVFKRGGTGGCLGAPSCLSCLGSPS